jgi:hypothetical protein
MRSLLIFSFLLISGISYSQPKVKRFVAGSGRLKLPEKGVWNFYSPRGELEQRYDFDQDSLLYFVKREGLKTKIIVGQDTIREEIDQPPLPVGGFALLYSQVGSFLGPASRSPGNERIGRVEIQLLINEAGEMVDPKVTKGLGSARADDVLNFFKKSDVRWLTAKKGGEKVKAFVVVSISFSSDN